MGRMPKHCLSGSVKIGKCATDIPCYMWLLLTSSRRLLNFVFTSTVDAAFVSKRVYRVGVGSVLLSEQPVMGCFIGLRFRGNIDTFYIMDRSPIGRPVGKSNVRNRLIGVGREHFLAFGYAKATLRGIAADAQVDHALVKYYFGGKEGLFKAVLELTITPGQAFSQVIADRPPNLAAALLNAALDIWEDPVGQEALTRLLLSSETSPFMHVAFRDYLQNQMIRRLADVIGGQDASYKAATAGAVIAGLFFTRYVLCVEPVAVMTKREVVAYFGPILNASLTRLKPA